MPAKIRIQTDRISAQMARDRLRQEGIPAEVVSDDDSAIGMSTIGSPLAFSLVVPSDREAEARAILAGSPRKGGRVRRSRAEARTRRRP
jgi:hypothetical protein